MIDEYERGVEKFIQFAQRNANSSGHDEVKFRCLFIKVLGICLEFLLMTGIKISMDSWIPI